MDKDAATRYGGLVSKQSSTRVHQIAVIKVKIRYFGMAYSQRTCRRCPRVPPMVCAARRMKRRSAGVFRPSASARPVKIPQFSWHASDGE